MTFVVTHHMQVISFICCLQWRALVKLPKVVKHHWRSHIFIYILSSKYYFDYVKIVNNGNEGFELGRT